MRQGGERRAHRDALDGAPHSLGGAVVDALEMLHALPLHSVIISGASMRGGNILRGAAEQIIVEQLMLKEY